MEKLNTLIIPSYPNYRYDREQNRLFRGFGADVEIKAAEDGIFTLKKMGKKYKFSQGGLLSLTESLSKVNDSTRVDGQLKMDKLALVNDFKKGMNLPSAQKKYHISWPTAKKYQDIALGAYNDQRKHR